MPKEHFTPNYPLLSDLGFGSSEQICDEMTNTTSQSFGHFPISNEEPKILPKKEMTPHPVDSCKPNSMVMEPINTQQENGEKKKEKDEVMTKLETVRIKRDGDTMEVPNAIEVMKRREDGRIEKEYECGVCHRRYNKKPNCLTHSIIHTSYALQCHLCPKKFDRKINLQQHIIRSPTCSF
jgi:hypothetical protein